MTEPFTAKQAYADLAAAFRNAGFATPDLDARVLIAAIIGVDAARISSSDYVLTPAHIMQMQDWRARHLAHEPIARIIGRRGFWTLDLGMSAATLEPRPDTETLVELACEELSSRKTEALRMVDLGTGTGAVLLSLLHEFPQSFGVGIDLAFDAARTARINAQHAGMEKRAVFVCADWCAPLHARFDLIVSNPPYIPSAECDRLDVNVRLYDPRLALDGGADGLTAYRSIAAQAGACLAPGGRVMVEIGHDQEARVTAVFEGAGFVRVNGKNDLGGHMRALSFASR